ncbi:MAG: hypothetical protein ACI9OJ_001284, partial [Myxococcota bacterium]
MLVYFRRIMNGPSKSSFDRRRFLQMSGASLAALGLGCSSEDDEEPVVTTPDFGIPTTAQAEAMLPASAVAQGVLEVFMMGGLSPWDSFYAVPEHGDPSRGGAFAGQQWWTWQEGEDSVGEVFARCGGGDLLQPFYQPTDGPTVFLGPWTKALRDRPDILKRMRIVVLSHDLEPHEAAVPLCVAGHPRGSPRLASTGAHVQRFLSDQFGRRTAPHSYVLFPSSDTVGNFNVEAAASLGGHPGYARPLSVALRPNNPLPEQLTRSVLSGRASEVDAAVDWYTRRMRQRLIPAGGIEPLHSAGLTRFADARAALSSAPGLTTLLSPEVLAGMSGSACGFDAPVDRTELALRVGTQLLTSKTDTARYVHVVDSGIKEANNGGYDTHEHHVRDASVSVTHLCRQLAANINAPGESDPAKLDLDRHMVALTTEMGRTPYPQLHSIRGLNHWPYGFVAVLIGGPVGEDQAGISGAIGEDGRAT